jgi:hypothetical protein
MKGDSIILTNKGQGVIRIRGTKCFFAHFPHIPEKKRKRELLMSWRGRAPTNNHRQQPQDFDIHAGRWGRH